jgi:predicted dehydrogenase
MQSTKRFSLAGLGRMGRVHLAVAIENSLEINILFDADTSLAEKIISDFEIPNARIAGNVDEFAALSAGDIIGIATTSPAHLEIMQKVALAGSTLVVCEKPLVNSYREIEILSNLVLNHNLKIAVNHQMRYMDQYKKILEWQKEFALGKLLTMSVNAPNFGLGMNGTHYFEAFRWLVGEEIENISGWVNPQSIPNARGAQFYDYAGTVLGFTPSGSKLFLDFPEEAGHQIIVTYTFETGKITVNELKGSAYINARNEEDRDLPSHRYGLRDNFSERVVESVDLQSITHSVYVSFLATQDYPDWKNGCYAVRCALASILSAQDQNSPKKVNSSELDFIGALSWP